MAARAVSGRASEAVPAGGDGPPREFIPVQFFDPATLGGDRQFEHLVEVAIVQVAKPVDRQRRTAHDMRHGLRIEAVDQLPHVGLVLLGLQQVVEKAADRQVGDRMQLVEDNVVARLQLATIGVFQLGLIGWQRRSDRVVDQRQPQTAICFAVPKLVENPQRVDRTLKDPIPALSIAVVFQVTGQRRDHFDLVVGQELGEIAIAVGDQDGQVAAIDDAPVEGVRLLHKPAEVRIHFRSTAGDVERRDRESIQCRDDSLGRLARHAFAAVGACVDMAVCAGLVAKFADVDLQDFHTRGLKDRQLVLAEGCVEVR